MHNRLSSPTILYSPKLKASLAVPYPLSGIAVENRNINTVMSSTISQLSYFSSINRNIQLHRRTLSCPPLRSKLVVMSLEGRGAETSNAEIKTNLSYKAELSRSHVEETVKSFPTVEEPFERKIGTSEPVKEHCATQQKRTAKIHDFCLGIPFAGLVLCGGLVGYIFSRDPTTLSTNALFGGALLALSILSLKIWRKGKSSLPFILGQAVLSVALLWKNFQTYSLKKKLFPTGFYVAICAAMLCFYSYVVLSGGNPPPKKLSTAV